MSRPTPSADLPTAAPNPLAQLTLDQLRRRTSVKWGRYAPDMLPLWVVEMDVPLAPAVTDALQRAIALGDTGYAHPTGYAEAFGEFAAERSGWTDFSPGRTAVVPDVMLGIVEVLRLVTDPGDTVVVCSPVYPPFYAFARHAGRQVVEAPLGADLRIDLAALKEAFRRVPQLRERLRHWWSGLGPTEPRHLPRQPHRRRHPDGSGRPGGGSRRRKVIPHSWRPETARERRAGKVVRYRSARCSAVPYGHFCARRSRRTATPGGTHRDRRHRCHLVGSPGRTR